MNRRYLVLYLLALISCVDNLMSLDPPSDANKHFTPPSVTNDASDIDTGIQATSNTDASLPTPDVENTNSDYIYKHYDINHIGITGQSNSVALSAGPITLTQPYNNLSFNSGVMPMQDCDGAGCKSYSNPSSFIPLVEGDAFFYGSYAETLSSGFANEVSKLHSAHTSLVSIHGRSGNTYWCLRKGGCNYKPSYLVPFTQGMQEIKDAKLIASSLNKSYIVRAILTVHGESDHYSYTLGNQEFPLYGTDGIPNKIKNYADALLEWQSDYEAGAKSITGQAEKVPLFISQISGWNDTRESQVAQMQLDAHIRSNGNVILVTPGYLFTFLSDCKHYTSHSQRRLGEYFGKVYHQVIVEGKRWEPVRPKTITKNGNQLIIKYYVPTPPLVLDTDSITNPGNYGFDFVDDLGTTISQVNITGADTITITLSRPPGNNAKLTYAQNQLPNTCIGIDGARGNVRDSDNTPSQYGYKLYNYGVMFNIKI